MNKGVIIPPINSTNQKSGPPHPVFIVLKTVTELNLLAILDAFRHL